VISKTLKATGALKPPLFVRLVSAFPFLSRFTARMLGLGFRPEHIAQHIRAANGR
ncbi:MAG TPA: FAD-dependent oxidoreductase, partial [Hyphomicrobium sp.]|nr:FAD-dependent oxidoreductase [Hyphomicrobium sp.]